MWNLWSQEQAGNNRDRRERKKSREGKGAGNREGRGGRGGEEGKCPSPALCHSQDRVTRKWQACSRGWWRRAVSQPHSHAPLLRTQVKITFCLMATVWLTVAPLLHWGPRGSEPNAPQWQPRGSSLGLTSISSWLTLWLDAFCHKQP